MITKEVLSENKSFPLLIMGGAVVDFKKNYSGRIIRLENADDVREFVSYYDSVANLDRMLVFEDLSFLPDSCEGLLLKFVEESKLDLVMLSLFDKVSLTLLSRVKRVMKYSREKVNSDFNSVSVGAQRLDESLKPDSHYYDKVRYMGMYSPLMFYLDRNIKRERNKAKILSFLD